MNKHTQLYEYQYHHSYANSTDSQRTWLNDMAKLGYYVTAISTSGDRYGQYVTIIMQREVI